MTAGVFDRFDATKLYDALLFRAGRPLQSAELNEIQSTLGARMRGITDTLYHDGSLISGCQISVDPDTGATIGDGGQVYIRGAVRQLPARSGWSIAINTTVSVGAFLVETDITETDDPTLLDPAPGQVATGEGGAARLKRTLSWGYFGEVGKLGDFFPIYTVENGRVLSSQAPPELDPTTQAIATYARDSSGGSFVVDGLVVSRMPDLNTGEQVYSVAHGRARVNGFAVDLPTGARVIYAPSPDQKAVVGEPHVSSTIGAQRVNTNRSPIVAVTQVTITAQRTVTMVRGGSIGGQDPLPDATVVAILSVTQGGTTYAFTTDYLLTANKVNWSPAGTEPAAGSSYSVTYTYIATAALISDDATGFSISGAVVGTAIQVNYSYEVSRYDRLCLAADGRFVWVIGIAADYAPVPPPVPSNLLLLATILQTWTIARSLSNDGVRVVPMKDLVHLGERLDALSLLVAQQRLESDANMRDSGLKKGVLAEPFVDDSFRDAGQVQTAASFNGMLTLPLTGIVALRPNADITVPATLNFTSAVFVRQQLRTGAMKINPYTAFSIPPAEITLDPPVDHWVVFDTVWLSPITVFLQNGLQVPAWQLAATPIQTVEVLVGQGSYPLQFMREIPIHFTASGLGVGEIVASIKFAGIDVTPGPAPVADGAGVVTGSFTIPPNIPVGTKSVEILGAGGTYGSTSFTGDGTHAVTIHQMRTIAEPYPTDPVAQTFTPATDTMMCGVDVFVTAKGSTPITVQIRETLNGYPARIITAQAVKLAAAVTVGDWNSFSFPVPIALTAGVEYSVVVLCQDSLGAVAIATAGEFDASIQQWVTTQPYAIGVLFSSSNASTWTAHQASDLTFRALRAVFSPTTRTINLGTVTVAGITDLLIGAVVQMPSPDCQFHFELTMPDASVITAAPYQPVKLSAAVTGAITVRAVLIGTSTFSPVLFPGTQIIAGAVSSPAAYISRAITAEAGESNRVKLVIETLVPADTSITPYIRPGAGGAYTAMEAPTAQSLADGWVEYTYELHDVDADFVWAKLVLTGTPAARPQARALRVMVM